MIDKATIERIMETTNVVEVVSDFVALKRQGANFVACCPFHTEKTPSFHVSSSKGIYKCFGCGKSGNAVTFLMEHEQMSYTEAIKYLGAKYGIEIKEKDETPEDIARRQKRESLLIVNDFAQKVFASNLTNSQEGKVVGMEYFNEREISEDSIVKFGLGYALKENDSFTKLALSKGYKADLLIECGLIKQSAQGENQYYDGFRERVIFPIKDISGRVVAFGARKIASNNNLPKYINSPESEVYIKNKTLYGLFEAKKTIEKEDCCYLVEGYTDVISLHQKGITGVVASCGTSLTEGQIRLIKRFTNKITVLYDGDSAGIHASVRGIDMFLSEGFEVSVVLFPDGEDPDSFARSHTEEELKDFLITAKEDFISFKCRLANRDDIQNDPIKKSELIRDISQSIAKIPDPVLRSLYAKQTSQNLDISLDAINEQIGQFRVNAAKEQTKPRVSTYYNPQKESPAEFLRKTAPSKSSFSALYNVEKEIIYYLVKYGQEKIRENQTVSEFIKAHIEVDNLSFEDSVLQSIYNEYFTLKDDKLIDPIKYFSLKTDNDCAISKIVIDIFEDKYRIRSNKIKESILDEKMQLEKLIQKVIYRYKALVCDKNISQLRQQMKMASDQGDKQAEENILKKINTLNRVKLEFEKVHNK